MKAAPAIPPPPPLPTAARGLPVGLLLGVCGVFLVGVLLVLHQFDPARHGFYPGCTFHQVTGLDCPGCGGLRATHHLLHGRVTTALRHNALVVLAAPILAVWLARWLWRRWRGIPPRISGLSTAWVWVILGGMLLFSVARNLPFAPFTQLAP